MNISIKHLAFLFAAGLTLATAEAAICCPFCSTQGQTLTEEMGTMDAVVVAELVQRPPEDKESEPGDDVGRATFRVLEVLKGTELVSKGQKFETLYFGDAALGSKFIVMAVDPQKLLWSTPLVVNERALEYIRKLPKLPADGPERLTFFQSYLEDDDELLARDAYDEFAKTPYDVVRQMKANLKHDKLVEWVKDISGVQASHRKLYLTLLGVCGDEKDVPFLEGLITGADKRQRIGLDALVGCYLTLRGDDGVPLVEEKFLKNKDSDYAETYATIMALRFHATESDAVSKKRIVQALRCMLDRPELADLVIPDLARMEDWQSAPKLMELYRTADERSSWVRSPVINFLRACPDKEKMADYLKECEKIDPQAVKRANNFFPFGAGAPAPTPTPPKTSQTEPAGEANIVRRVSATEPVAASPAAAEPVTVAKAGSAVPREVAAEFPVASNLGAARAAAALNGATEPWHWSYLLGVPCLLGGVLLFVQWRVLCFAG